ncbi:hypothetical protein A2911_00950 [Candidatus Nomurabacteria bacterium RIFCSPLOWO2_01_FULL_40_15]|uniref:Uncharacterized protein n=1 Tax=Candidatus Nomurabacteria bacterium RIFCSPLOWO2_01_FULL_40_15 TaxID=1801772 RepID=A0A1F6X4R5_9BACT|nr:MAG: hypothetical protein A2911_00950 [Candidatus Nomurabacteria bacterium RIFCSPLOWO2_01_FULL_40_15]
MKFIVELGFLPALITVPSFLSQKFGKKKLCTTPYSSEERKPWYQRELPTSGLFFRAINFSTIPDG